MSEESTKTVSAENAAPEPPQESPFGRMLRDMAALADRGAFANVVVCVTTPDGRGAHRSVIADPASYALVGVLQRVSSDWLTQLKEAERVQNAVEAALAQREQQARSAPAAE